MKRALKVIACAGALAIAVGLVCQVAGCRSVDCSNSDTAEFPTVEKWWK